MSTPARFSDGQYKNWLKCSQSLIILKEALHDYIDNEVKKLHGNITQKVSSIPCGSSIGNQCGSCSSKNITLRHGNWNINCKKNICDKWLHQILSVHDEPHNPTINWKNADISKWPTDCYQVAKIFMPKGQSRTTKMPEDLDAPAILSLMKYCNWFRKDLPNTQILSDLIDIRNKVLHSGDLSIADGNKDSWIDLMIQLLSDLNIHNDAQSELEMLKREDIDINFRETEIRVLRNLVPSLERDLTTVKEDMALVQNLQSQLSEEVKHLRDNTTETTRNVDTLETDTERMRKSLDELKTISEKMVSFFDKNRDILDIKIMEIIRNISIDIQNQQRNLVKVETEQLDIKARLSNLEEEIKQLRKNQNKYDQKLKGVKRKLEEQKEEGKQIKQLQKNQKESNKDFKRVKRKLEEQKEEGKQMKQLRKNQKESNKDFKRVKRKLEERKGNDEQLSLQKGAPRKKRPESDDLKKLKNQTEDNLDTFRRLECISTKQSEEAKKLFEGKRSIVIRGNPGEGKTTTALYLIDNEKYRDRRVVLYCPQDWKTVDTDWVDIVVLEDILGQFEFDSGRLGEWMMYLPTIEEHVDVRKLQVIITTRDDILSTAYSKLGSLKLFSDDLSLTLSSKQLKDSEKISLLNRQLERHEKNMKEEEKEKCIANFSGLIGFPQCCSLFAGDSKSFDRGPEFFRSPEKFFVANINKLDATRMLSLAFLFCNGELCEENLSPETIPETSKQLLMELASHLHISGKEAAITLLRDAYDNFLELYVVKSISYKQTYIRFTHATVCEAVGHVLGGRCPEIVVKYGDSEYLYQRTYTAIAKDSKSQNVFIPASVYGLLAQRMVDDVVKRGLVESVAKHTALEQQQFLMKLKCKLHDDNEIKDFFMAVPEFFDSLYSDYDDDDDLTFNLSEGNCITFMQYILQSDEGVVRLVYSQFLEFLACAHNNNSSDCWQCQEKQKLLELALYYHHFQIADELINMKACYTHVSLCNTARHGDLRRVQTILETLKRNQVFNPGCTVTKNALIRAYISGNQSLIELLLKEGIILDCRHVIDAVEHGDMDVLMKVVDHLKCHKKWKPHWEKHSTYWNSTGFCFSLAEANKIIPCSRALFLTYFHEKVEMADYLLKNEVKVSMYMFVHLSAKSSQQAVARVIQALKDTENWDPKCDDAVKALENAYSHEKYDVCDLLIQEGVSLTMKNLPMVVYSVTFEYIKKAVQHLKDNDNWDPLCDNVSRALENAYRHQKYDVCDLLIQEGVLLTMKYLPDMVYSASLEYIKKAIQHLKDTDKWDPMCDDASKALENAYRRKKYDMCDLLVQEGVSLTIKNLPDMVYSVSLEYIKKAIQHLKNTHNWDPKCDDVSKALENACEHQNFHVCDLLVQEGVSLTIKNLPDMVSRVSFEYIKKAIQNLKDTDNWDPKCHDAFGVFKNAYGCQRYDVCDLLIQEGVSLTMENLPIVVYSVSLKSVKKEIQNLQDTDSWDPMCCDASEALENAYKHEQYNVCNLLVQEGVSLTMRNLPGVTGAFPVSLETVKKAIQHLKDTGNWNPKCDDASKALENAYRKQDYYVCDQLVQEGVSLTMKNLPDMVHRASCECIKQAIQNLKITDNWDPMCYDASEALENAYRHKKYDVCDLLAQEGVSLKMKNLPDMVSSASFEYIKKTIQNLKDIDNWDPKSDAASKAFENAYIHQNYDVCDLLGQEGVLLTMKNLPSVVYSASWKSVKKTIQNLKDTDNWDPMCDDASETLENAYSKKKYDVCDLLAQEGVSPAMKNLSGVTKRSVVSFETVVKVIQHLQDTDNWNHKCDDASEALVNASRHQKYDVCDLLVQEGVSLKMKNLPDMVSSASFEYIKKTIQNLKDTENWDPKCDDASKAFENAYYHEKYDVCDLLVQEGVSLTMEDLPIVVYSLSLKSFKRGMQNLKDTDGWDPKCDDASKALENAYTCQKYDVCDMLVQEGVSLTMKNLPILVYSVTFEYIKKAIQHLKDIDNWDPMGDDASKTLENAFRHQKYALCDLLIQEGVSLTVKNLPGFTGAFHVSLETVKKAIQHLKDTDNWNPKCDDASGALTSAYSYQNYDVCELLFQEGVSLTMKNLPRLVHSVSLKSVKKAIHHLKGTDNWDPKCDAAFKAFENASSHQKYDVCDLLFQEGVSLAMKNLPSVIYSVPLKLVKKEIQHLKDTDNWDPKCDDASKALENAYKHQNYGVYDLLVQEGVSLAMKNLPSVVHSVSLKSVKKVVQHLKDTDNWNPKCHDASRAFENASSYQKYDVCDLLFQEGFSSTMKNLPRVVHSVSLKSVKKAIQHLKDMNSWNPECDDASKALENSYTHQKYDVCDLLVQEGVSLTMKNLPRVVHSVSLKSVKKAIQNLKDTNNWDPKCDDASKAFENAFSHDKYDMCDLLVQEGVSLTAKNLPIVVYSVTFEYIKKAIQNLKDTGNWDPKCEDASKALENAYTSQKYDVCDLLVQERVSLRMKNLPIVVYSVTFEYIKKAIPNLKGTDNWDPKCDDASRSLENAYRRQKYDVCELLIQEGVSLTMKNIPSLVYSESLKSVKKAIKKMKDTDNWDPKCDDASKGLENAYTFQNYAVCDLLVQEGVTLRMKNLPNVVYHASLKSVKKAIQNLKDTDNWDPKCNHVSTAFENVSRDQKYNVSDLLIQEGVSLRMKNLPVVVYSVTLKSVKKTIQNLKDADNWDPKCDDASKALENAYTHQKHFVCDLLVQEGVALRMKNLPVVVYSVTLKSVKKTIQNLKDTGNWDPKCKDASKALENAYTSQKYDVCDLLVQERVSLRMKNLPIVVYSVTFEYIKKAILNLKDTDNWDPKCDDASRSLENAYTRQKYDVCEMLIQEGVLLRMKNLPVVVYSVTLKSVKKTIQNLKDTDNWDPKCDDASKALENAYKHQKYDVCDLLVLERVSLGMKNLPGITGAFHVSLETVKKAIQHLKDSDNWDPKCDDASKALENACRHRKYDVCNLLVEEGVSIAMKNLPNMVYGASFESIMKAI